MKTNALLLFLLFAGPFGFACRIIVPPRPFPGPVPPRPPRPPVAAMEVREHRATIEIEGEVVRVLVEATFYNPGTRQLEGTYVFPISRTAVVSSFTMTANGKTMEAELLEAGKARKIYEDIVRKMKDPALLEYVDQGLLRARVYPILPKSEVKIRLSYESVVQRDGGIARYAYPLLSAHPGAGRSIQQLAVEVKVKSTSPLRSIFAPGFEVDLKTNGSTGGGVFTAKNFIPDRDFEIIFSESERKVGVDFLAYRKDGEGYFMMVATPDSRLAKETVSAKNIVFIIDTSGSMMGNKMKQAKAALEFCINGLGSEDHFNIVRFSTDVEPLASEPLLANEKNRKEALEFIGGLRAMGGTAIDQALSDSLDLPSVDSQPSMFVLLTDGLPTIGETNVKNILKRVGEKRGGRRVFSLGVGYDVNTSLLDGIATNSRGFAGYVRPQENLEIAFSNFYAKIAHPVLTDLRLETSGVRLSQLNPTELPDLFHGGSLVITGRMKEKGIREMRLTGSVNGKTENFPFTANLDGSRRNSFLPRFWAGARVAYLQEQVQVNGKNPELIDEIKRLGRTYGILTEYTSFLIVEEGIEQEQLRGARRSFQNFLGRDMEKKSGKAAVERSIRQQRAKSADFRGAGGFAATPALQARKLEESNADFSSSLRRAGVKADQLDRFVRNCGEKTYYYRRAENLWYDSLIPAGKAVEPAAEMEAWSAEFFELLKKHPDLRRWIPRGGSFVVSLQGKIYCIRQEQ